jgi:predicted CopG family antitoxin
MEEEINQPKLSENTEKNQKPWLWKKGQSGNPAGRPKGIKNFSTIMDETVREIAKINNISPSEVWSVLIKKAYFEAKEGNYLFYKDILDRYFGKPREKIDITANDFSSLSLEEIDEKIKFLESLKNNEE